MPVATVLIGNRYANVTPVNGFTGWSIKTLPKPAEFLIMLDSKGNTLTCGGLKDAVTQINSSSGDTISAVDRHQGGVTCLFGDFHVEYVTLPRIIAMDGNCPNGNPTFESN